MTGFQHWITSSLSKPQVTWFHTTILIIFYMKVSVSVGGNYWLLVWAQKFLNVFPTYWNPLPNTCFFLNAHCLWPRSLSLCWCPGPGQSHRSLRLCLQLVGCFWQPDLCGCTENQTHPYLIYQQSCSKSNTIVLKNCFNINFFADDPVLFASAATQALGCF